MAPRLTRFLLIGMQFPVMLFFPFCFKEIANNRGNLWWINMFFLHYFMFLPIFDQLSTLTSQHFCTKVIKVWKLKLETQFCWFVFYELIFFFNFMESIKQSLTYHWNAAFFGLLLTNQSIVFYSKSPVRQSKGALHKSRV